MAHKKKKRTYNTRLIKENYTYSVEQIADLFGISIATVQRWISKEGLRRIPKTRPHLVHSSELATFHQKQKKARCCPCAPHEIFCCPCRSARTPKLNSASFESLPNGSVWVRARCSVCNGKINKTVKEKNWSENHPLAVYLHNASEQHSGEYPRHRECEVQEEE